MTKIQKYLAQNIKHYRNLLGLTQEQLAERVGTSTNYIGTIETCKKFPSPQMIEQIAKALNLDSSLLFQNDNKQPSQDTQNLTKFKKNLLKNIRKAINSTLTEI